MNKVIIILLCLCPAFMHAAGVASLPAAPGSPKSDTYKKAQAWVDNVLKELPDKLDRLILLNGVCEKGYMAYLTSQDSLPDYETYKPIFSLDKFPDTTKGRIKNLVSQLPQRGNYRDWESYYHAIEIYYHELQKRSEIPQYYIRQLSHELPTQTKDRRD